MCDQHFGSGKPGPPPEQSRAEAVAQALATHQNCVIDELVRGRVFRNLFIGKMVFENDQAADFDGLENPEEGPVQEKNLLGVRCRTAKE